MKFGTVELKDISTYRTQLMGIATLMIIVCHAPASGVLLPDIIARISVLGNYGVDLFLFLSGIGVYNSFYRKPQKNLEMYKFWKKRFIRIFFPYLIIYIPYCIAMMLLGEYTFNDTLLCLSAIEFWFNHRGAWFVSLILVLYLISPLLYVLMTNRKKYIYVLLIVSLIVFLSNISLENQSNSYIIYNMQGAFSRAPSFIIGMAIGQFCIDKTQLSISWLVILATIGAVLRIYSFTNCTNWTVVPIIIYCLLNVRHIIRFDKILIFFGKISLESYLFNITINMLFCVLIPDYFSSPLFYGRWLEYFIVITLGTVLAYFTNRLVTILREKMVVA